MVEVSVSMVATSLIDGEFSKLCRFKSESG